MDAKSLRTLSRIIQKTKGHQTIIYKGIDLSLNYYPKRNLRKYVDIDICVRRKDYASVKQQIMGIPGVLLITPESSVGSIIHGHAVFIVPRTSLMLELHISKNPRNIWEYLLGLEYRPFFQGLHKIKLGKYYYYSLARSEYLAVIVRQLLKKVSLGNSMYHENMSGVLFKDFALILKKNEGDGLVATK